ncbi:MAG: hypothetical protein IJH11_03220 [Lachnospiraceae bacterium]|nr:hypothetical protein [Lachnospiraceae bacterium]
MNFSSEVQTIKKIIKAFFVSLLVLTVAACGNNNPVGEASPPAQTPEAVAAAQNSAGAAELSESNVSSDDEFQNPTMNFIGPYAADGAEMEVSASGKSDAEFKVTWSKEDSAVSVWTMSGEMNADTFTVEYVNCVKKDYVYNEDGSVESETSVYEDGTGRIIFNPQDWTLVWEDEKEHAADALIFEYSYSAAEAAESGEQG